MQSVMTGRVAGVRGLMGCAGLAALAACVTINVYFPAAEVQRAADQLIDEVWGDTSGPGRPGAPAPALPSGRPNGKSSGTPSSRSRVGSEVNGFLGFILRQVIPAAHAQANIDVWSPAIEKLKRSMQRRHAKLEPYYSRGTVGLTEDGLITERDRKAVPLKERQAVVGWIAAENRDRKTLYREIARANGHPEWEAQVRSTFAGRWISKAAAGWWYRMGTGWRER